MMLLASQWGDRKRSLFDLQLSLVDLSRCPSKSSADLLKASLSPSCGMPGESIAGVVGTVGMPEVGTCSDSG